MAKKLKIIKSPSPYFTNTTIEPKFIVLHCLGYENPLEVLMKNQASCHYLIPQQNQTDDYQVHEVVRPPLRAWHAGISHWKNVTGLNDHSIGIEIHMPDYARALQGRELNFLFFKPYQNMQIQALVQLVKQLQQEYAISPENVIGHSDIAPWRESGGKITLAKTDPGPTLPWKELARHGIGVWPEIKECVEANSSALTASTAQKLLSTVGYAVTSSGFFDSQTKLSLGAARMHFLPGCYNNETQLADTCYTAPFDSELHCALSNVATGNVLPSDDDASGSYHLILLFSASASSLLFLCLFLYFFCRDRSERNSLRGNYQPVSTTEIEVIEDVTPSTRALS